MIESLFITCIAIAFLTFILGIENESKLYSALSTMLWTIVMLSATGVTIPGDAIYSELGFSAFCLAFISINIIWQVLLYFEESVQNKNKLKYRL